MTERNDRSSRASPDRAALDGLRTEVRLPSVSWSYRFWLLVVGVAMVALPVAYLGFIGIVAYGIYYHAVENVGIMGGGGLHLRALLYVVPLAAGCILFFFLVKPLLAPPATQPDGYRLHRRDQPLLCTFIERLCRILDAPVPTRINADVQINASAGLDLNMVTMTRNETILTIGLPVVAGMSLMEFTGVLAHEFGHFRQGSGMRVSQLIRRVNYWFARVVYERDEWDEKLVEWSEDESSTSFIAMLVRFCVWVSRGVLWVLMMLGHGISSFLMREMEYDADQYEVIISGSDTFPKTALRLRLLNYASQMAYSELADAWNEGRLSDNLPLHIAGKADTFTKEIIDAIRQSTLAEGTGLFDTHPSDSQRVEQTHQMNEPGIFRVRGPAGALFRDFEGLSRQITLDHYRQVLGEVPTDRIISNEAFQAHQDQHRSGEDAVPRFFQGLLSASRFLEIGRRRLPEPTSAKKSLQALLVARMRFEEGLPQAMEAYPEYDRAIQMQSNAFAAAHLLRAGLTPDRESFTLPTASHNGVDRLERRAHAIIEAQLGRLNDWEKNLTARLIAALETLQSPDVAGGLDDGKAMLARARELLPCQYVLQLALQEIVDLGERLQVMSLFANQFEDNTDNEQLLQQIVTVGDSIQRDLFAVHERLSDTPYPFSKEGAQVSCAGYLLAELPEDFSFRFAVGGTIDLDLLNAILEGAQELCQRYYTLHVRVLGQLALIAERVEEAVGLPPMAEPEELPDETMQPEIEGV